MTRFLADVADSLTTLPTEAEIAILLVTDGGAKQLFPFQQGTLDLFRTLAKELKVVHCEGGKSNIPALLEAWDLVAASSQAVIVWIHGPIPEIFDSPEPLVQRWQEAAGKHRLFEVQSEPGPNRVTEALGIAPGFESVIRRSSLSADLRRVFSACNLASVQTEMVRESGRRQPEQAIRVSPESVWAHACLWANDRIIGFLKEPHPNEPAALKLAKRYQLVTPVSGAVVLETDLQYTITGVVGGVPPTGSRSLASLDEPLALTPSAGSGLVANGEEVGFDFQSAWSQSGSGIEALILIPVAFLLIAKLLLHGPMIRIPFQSGRK
jgi:hypothetical protein